MIKSGKQHKLGSIFVLLVFCMFIFAVLLVLLLGAKVLRSVSQSSEKAFTQRTCVQYISEKIRHYDAEGAVFISGFSSPDGEKSDDIETLYLSEEIDGEIYYVRIYCYDGSIYELFSEASALVSPADGTIIAEAEALNFGQNGSLLSFTVENSDGSTSSISLKLRCQKEALS